MQRLIYFYKLKERLFTGEGNKDTDVGVSRGWKRMKKKGIQHINSIDLGQDNAGTTKCGREVPNPSSKSRKGVQKEVTKNEVMERDVY